MQRWRSIVDFSGDFDFDEGRILDFVEC